MSERAWEFARVNEGDIPELLELTRLVHGDTGLANPDYFRWLTVDNPAGRAIDWVAKAKSTGQIVAIVLGVAVDFKIMADEGKAYYPLNLLVHPDFRRQGIITELTQHSLEDYRQHGAAFAYGSPGRRLKNAWLKFQPVTMIGQPPLLLCPFDVKELLSGMGLPGKPLHGLAGLGYRLFKSLSNVNPRRWLGRSGPTNHGMQLHLEEIVRFDERFDRFWEKTKNKYPVMLVRDAAFLQWRYKDIPLKQYECLSCQDHAGEVVGYIVFRNVPLKGVETGMILDFLTEPSQRGQVAGLRLITAATQTLKQAGSAAVVCRMLRHTEECHLLRRQGYVLLPARLDPWPITLIGRLWLENVSPAAFFSRNHWFYTLGDWGIDAFSA